MQPFPLQNLIGGIWQDSTGGQMEDVDPATGEVLALAPRSTPEDVAAAVAAAREALPRWRRLPPPRRGEILYRAGEILRQRKEELARALTREMGKVLVEARGDVQEAIDMAFYMAGEGRRAFGVTTPSELPDKMAFTVREPIGVGAIITPWNFPAAIPAWKIFPSLVLGNTVVFKPASQAPFLAYELVRTLEDAGVPPGVVNLVFGGGHEVGEALVAHPGIDYVSFTGSVAVGARVGELAGGKLRRAILELGGKNAAVVLADADLQLAAEAIVWGAFGTSGQRCTATSRLIVERTVHDALLERLVARTKALKVGNGLAEDVDVGPVVSREALLRIHGYVERAVAEGAHLVVGGRVLSEGEFAKGFFYEPTILDDVRPEMEIAQEEVFGPVLAVITVDSLEEAIEVHNATSYGLSASIFTADVARAFAAVRAFAAGIVYVNHSTSGAEIHLPFGGVRQSGNGHREAGPTALDAYSEWKTVYIDYSGRLQRAQIDTEERTRW